MKLAIVVSAAFALLAFLPSSTDTACAHGGAYRGPAGEVPPGQRDPKDPQPPPTNPATPTGNTPGGTGSPNHPEGSGEGAGDTPDSPPPPAPRPDGPVGGNPRGGIVTPRGRPRAPARQIGYDNWLFWWAYNKDDILNLKQRLRSIDRPASTGFGPHRFGRSLGGEKAEPATQQEIRTRIVPALLAVIGNEGMHADIRGGAMIALARADPSDRHVPQFVAAARNSKEQLVRESAVLALGILQSDSQDVRDFLLELIEDREYPMRSRCFAMLSIGLLKDRSDAAFKALRDRLDSREVHQDVPICALLAIGLIGDEKRIPDLHDWLVSGRVGREKLGDLEKAWVVAALGKIGHARALPTVSRQLKLKGRYTKRSAAIALGQIVPSADEKTQLSASRTLARFHANEGDLTARNLSLIALGRIAGREQVTDKVRNSIMGYLKTQFAEANPVTERPFVALAMGLIGFEAESVREELSRVIRPAFEKRGGDQVALGALAISLGMLHDKKSVPSLIACLEDRGLDKKLRGASAMALGLIGDRSASAAILKALKERDHRELRVDTAVAAGLLGNSDAMNILVGVLNDRKASQFVLGSVALALGQIGDRIAVEPMVEILEPEKPDGTYPDLTRALVTVALGQLADQRELRVLSRISKDINYRASVPALVEILSIL